VVAFSSACLVFRAPLVVPLGTAFAYSERPVPVSSEGTTPIGPERAADIATRVFPGSALRRIYLPRDDRDSYRVTVNLSDEPWSAHAASSVWVDQYSGAVLDTWTVPGAPTQPVSDKARLP